MQPHANTHGGALDDPWRRDVQQVMHKVRYLCDILKSQNLGMLTGQLEQAGYRVVASHPVAEAADRSGDGVRFIQVARSCIREIEYQLFLAKEAGLPGRRAHEPLHKEFCEIRRMLATCIRRVRKWKA